MRRRQPGRGGRGERERHRQWGMRHRLLHRRRGGHRHELPLVRERPSVPFLPRHAFTAFCSRHGYSVTFHALRHSNAVALLTQGVDVKTAADRLGHNPAVLLRTYAHHIPSADHAAAERLDAVFVELAAKPSLSHLCATPSTCVPGRPGDRAAEQRGCTQTSPGEPRRTTLARTSSSPPADPATLLMRRGGGSPPRAVGGSGSRRGRGRGSRTGGCPPRRGSPRRSHRRSRRRC